jgi:biotin carboxyl carrier protein
MRRYHATLGPAGGGGRAVDLEVDREEDGSAGRRAEAEGRSIQSSGDKLRVVLDGRVHELDAHTLPDGAISLLVDGRAFSAEFEEKGERVSVLLRHSVFQVEVLDERRLRMKAATGRLTTEGPQVVVAPMPGKVVRVLVKVGDEVKEGQGLVVVEAMKMENELKAVKAGRVKQVAVSEGVTVEGGVVLCVVE